MPDAVNSLQDIEVLTSTYADRRQELAGLMTELEIEVERVKRAAMPGIRQAIGVALDARDALHRAIEESPAHFVKPRTRVISGIRVGMKEKKPCVTFTDEDATIAKIRERVPKDQAELLIRTVEKVHKPAVYDLDVADLRRLGIKLEGGGDVVYIKPQDSDVSKLIDTILEKGQEVEDL